MNSLMLLMTFVSADLMLDLVNSQRKAANVGLLTLDTICIAGAKQETLDQSTHLFMGHVGSDGSTVGDRMTKLGFKWDAVAENVAVGQNSVEEVMAAWMNSEGHRANILNPRYTRFGYYEAKGSDGRNYWTQTFAHEASGFKSSDVNSPAPIPQQVQEQKVAISAPKVAPVATQPTPQKDEKTQNAPAPTKATETKQAPIEAKPQTSQAPEASEAPKAPQTPEIITEYESYQQILDGFKQMQIPKLSLNQLPQEIQNIAGNQHQYCDQVLEHLKGTVKAADLSSHYSQGHPALQHLDKYSEASYAEYTSDEGSFASKLSIPLFSLLILMQ
eukprot:NODE_459_length_7203_cov_0.898226.p2 type:complete len:330 gc:universal NODE_459_length_7203_cov_0.898226:5688-6677(+)